MIDDAMTGSFQFSLPKDLLSEAKRQTKHQGERFRVEGWRTSWLSRVTEVLVGED